MKNFFTILIGCLIMAGSTYLSIFYLFRTPAPIKIVVMLSLVIIYYITISEIRTRIKSKNK